MDKKTPYCAYYYSTVDSVAQSQLKSSPELPLVDVAATQQRMSEKSIDAVIQGDPDYHWRLQTAPAAPYVLYYQGSLSVLDRPTLAIVGPRLMSPYAEQILESLFEQLQYFDIVTVSGLAPGVDTLCHELSLKYHIPTIAVLGGGFQIFLRGEKRELMNRIVEAGGLIVSEYKHSFRPTSRSFPQRNRIIAGLADVIFLPEAKEKSGSLITAEIGCELKKTVVAPMNSIFLESSAGTNSFIESGHIVPVSNLSSFLEKYYTRLDAQMINIKNENYTMCDNFSADERKIMEIVQEKKELSLVMIAENIGFPSQKILAYVSMLEMKGALVEKSPGIYVCAPRKRKLM